MDRRYSKRYRQTFPSVCWRHFKPSDYLPSLTGRKRTLKPTAVPSVLHWKKRSPVKWKASTRRSPIKRKKATEKATTKADLPTCDSTCEVFLEPQETPFLSSITENLVNTTVDQPADDSQSISFVTFKLKMNGYVKKSTRSRLKQKILSWKWRNWHIESAY